MAMIELLKAAEEQRRREREALEAQLAEQDSCSTTSGYQSSGTPLQAAPRIFFNKTKLSIDDSQSMTRSEPAVVRLTGIGKHEDLNHESL